MCILGDSRRIGTKIDSGEVVEVWWGTCSSFLRACGYVIAMLVRELLPLPRAYLTDHHLATFHHSALFMPSTLKIHVHDRISSLVGSIISQAFGM